MEGVRTWWARLWRSLRTSQQRPRGGKRKRQRDERTTWRNGASAVLRDLL